MKKIMFSVCAVALSMAMTSCSALGLVGLLYTDVTNGAQVVPHTTVGNKVGKSGATSILGLIATGDAGINAACKDGGIKKISHIDIQSSTVLGLWSTQKTFVYGE